MDDDYKLVFSTLSTRVTRDGITVDVQIYRGKDETGWLLEVVDHLGGSTVWDDRFPTDVEALQQLPQRPKALQLGRPVQAVPAGGPRRGHQPDLFDVAEHPRRPPCGLRRLLDRQRTHRHLRLAAFCEGFRIARQFDVRSAVNGPFG